MRAPRFWQNPATAPGLWPRLLWPLSRVWSWQTARRLARGARVRVDVPVICVGNLTAGGTGKTPTVIWLIETLQARGVTVHVVTRGHGGREAGPLQVDERRHSAADVGDEALLLSAHAPTWVARARAAGAQAAVAAGAGVIVLDDGFQNPGLEKDLSIVVIDTGVGFGNGRIIPAGPLREPVAAGLARADLVLGIGAEAVPADARAAGRPVLRGQLTPLQTGMDWRGLRVLAFAGIGRPGKFFATLRSLGAEVVQTVPLADHAALPPRLMARLIAEAKLRNAQLVTTEKDAVRLSAGDKRAVLTLPVRLEIRDADALMAKLDRLGL